MLLSLEPKRWSPTHNFLTGKGGYEINGLPIHKGQSFLEAGYIYTPYIPMVVTTTVSENNDFQPSGEIVSRYAKKVVNNRFYGNITVSEFDNLGND